MAASDAWQLAEREIRVGVTAWTEPSLVAAGTFYPAEATSAEARLRYYASRFPIAEIDATYYASPSPRNVGLWAARTPDGFVFDAKAFRLLTGHPTPPESLWGDLRAELPPALRAKPAVYALEVPHHVVMEAMRRFFSALEPLRLAGRLGAVVFQFPRYVYPSERMSAHLLHIAQELGPLQGAVEFRQARWLDDQHRDRTLAYLADLDLAYVCVDGPQGFTSSIPPIAEVTTEELAVVRLHGRNRRTWERKGIKPSDRFAYDYADAELTEWVPRIEHLRDRAKQVHVLANTCHGDYGIRAAQRLAHQLSPAVDQPVALSA